MKMLSHEAGGYAPVPGGNVFYRMIGGGEAAPLLTLHGGPGFPHNAFAPLAQLGDERAVVFYDQLGCGQSDRPDDPSLWRIERAVEEVDALRLPPRPHAHQPARPLVGRRARHRPC